MPGGSSRGGARGGGRGGARHALGLLGCLLSRVLQHSAAKVVHFEVICDVVRKLAEFGRVEMSKCRCLVFYLRGPTDDVGWWGVAGESACALCLILICFEGPVQNGRQGYFFLV